MSNIAGKAYAMNVLTPVRPSRTWLQTLIFMVARNTPSQLSGLLGLRLIHFARWVMIRRSQWPYLGQDKDPSADDYQGREELNNDYMLFLSNFNGTWDQYIDAFADGIPTGLDFFWYASTQYPHSIPIFSFKEYITANQLQTSYYYNATPGAAQRDIKAALRVRAKVLDLAAAHGQDAASFAAAYRAALASVQNSLGSPGLAPSASIATELADEARQAYVAAASAAAPPAPAAFLAAPVEIAAAAPAAAPAKAA